MINFIDHINHSGQNAHPSRKKPIYPIKEDLRKYLVKYGREVKLPFAYSDLQKFTYTVPLKDKHGLDTAWEKVSYDLHEWKFLRESLIKVYAILKTEGDMSYIDHLDVARIDYCFFGNSKPFRIRIINKFNDNYDHYYIKQADASRVYGLELEHLLSPNRMTYFTSKETLIEEHIPGIPGDVFIADYLNSKQTNQIRLAKEFVKFNERCFVQLLGDMRSYNFVVNIIPDIEDFQYRIRAIANKQSATISVVSPTTLALNRTIALPRGSQPFGIAMSASGGFALVALEATGTDESGWKQDRRVDIQLKTN